MSEPSKRDVAIMWFIAFWPVWFALTIAGALFGLGWFVGWLSS